MLSIEWGVDDDGNMLIKDVQKVTEIQDGKIKQLTPRLLAPVLHSLCLWEKSNNQFKI
jgi:hypothetical protein